MRATAFNIALFADRFAATAPACLYGFGVCLLVRKILPVPEFLSPAVLAFAALCVLAVWLAADLVGRRRWFDREYAAAWLDLRNNAGGKIISGCADAPLPRTLPGLSARHAARRLAWPVVFVAVAALTPAPDPNRNVSGASLERQIAQMERDVEEAAVAEALPPPDVRELRRQLEQVRDLALRNPEAAAEALASIPSRLEDARTARLERAADAMEMAAAAGWRGLEEGGAQSVGTSADFEAAMERLRGTLDALAEQEGGGGAMDENLARAAAMAERIAASGTAGERRAGMGGTLSDDRMESILEAMRKYGDNVSDAERSAPGRGGRSPSREGALSRLETASEALDRLRESGEAVAGQPGMGGVNRGRGDAPLVFGGQSEKDGLKTDYRPLTKSGEASEPSDMTLRRERALPDDALPPEEFREPRRSAVDVPERVHAGRGGAVAGPARERAVRRYYETLEKTHE